MDSRGRPYFDVQLILLKDLLLVTEIKGLPSKKVRERKGWMVYCVTIISTLFNYHQTSIHIFVN